MRAWRAGGRAQIPPHALRLRLHCHAALAAWPAGRDERVDDFVAVITSMAASLCGRRNAKRRRLTLSDRAFVCRNPDRPDCGLVMDRDLNAAINLRKLAGSSSERQNACGEASAGRRREAVVKLSSVKQEPNRSASREEEHGQYWRTEMACLQEP